MVNILLTEKESKEVLFDLLGYKVQSDSEVKLGVYDSDGSLVQEGLCHPNDFRTIYGIFSFVVEQSYIQGVVDTLEKIGKSKNNAPFAIGQEVVRIKGDYVVGRKGIVIDLDLERQRARVDWREASKSWVSFKVIGLTSEYEVEDYIARKKGNT
jgi:hypothetical protein